MKISAVLITRDAAAHLEGCLASLDFADEIVVLDQNSSDGTVAIAERMGAKVHQGVWRGFGPTKRAAVDLARNRWILSIDADEEVTPELREAILALPAAPSEAAFAINRLSRFLGRWMRHCGWHPDWVVRLFDRERAGFDEKMVHESVRTEGSVGRLDGLLRHYTYDNLEQYLDKVNRYTTLSAEAAYDAGRRVTPIGALVRGKLTFVRFFVLRRGFLDGWHGLLLSLCSAWGVFVKYVKIWWKGRS